MPVLPIAEQVAGGDQARREALRIAPSQQLRDPGRADRRARGRARPAHGREHRAGEHVGDAESAGNAMQPGVERAVHVGAGAGLADRRTHQHEQRNGQQREVIQTLEELVRHLAEVGGRHEQRHERQRRQAERKGDRHAGEQQREGHHPEQDANRGAIHIECYALLAAWL